MRIDSGDTAWLLVCTALVLFMTPGLALFYGGMVRSKNVLGMLVQNLTALAVVSIAWAVAGYSIAFGPDAGGKGLLGTLHFLGLAHPDQPSPGVTAPVPPQAFMAFQMMFAVITAALITGAGADRLQLGGFVLFAVLWSVVVYAPLAHWVFAPTGWLSHRGMLDFAGGTVVEMNSGASALAVALVLGRRRGWPRDAMPPHSLPLTVVGAGILWFGWLGFNAGSALGANNLAAHALVNTHLAGCGGLVAWAALERLRTGRATTLGAVSGAVAGLVAITPANGYVGPMPALVIGVLAGAACVYAVEAKFRLRYDDSLDVLGVHFVGGLVGVLSIGLFADRAVNGAARHDGLLLGGGLAQLGEQALGAAAAAVFSFGLSYLLAAGVARVVRLRVTEQAEYEGIDTAVHAESAYDFGAVRAFGRLG